MTTTSRNKRLLLLLEGCGAGVLLILRYAWPHLSPRYTDLYHRVLPMNTVFGGVAIDLALACLGCVILFWLLSRFDREGTSLAWTVIGAGLFTQFWAFFEDMGYLDSHLIRLLPLAAICIGLGVIVWLLRRNWYRRSVKVMRGGLALLGISIVWMLPQLVYRAVRPEPHDQRQFARAVLPAQRPQRRVIWILFDELSQDQSFDHRQPGLDLPQLDHFRSQSVMFSDVRPAGYYTELVLPSLFWGRIVTGERSNLSGDLYVRSSGRWQLYPLDKTVFADAQRAGWSSGLAGWYNPYCRTYGEYLDWCAWTLAANPDKYRERRSLWWNVNAPLQRVEKEVVAGRRLIPVTAGEHARDYRDLMRWSHQLINDGNIGFVFLHLPLPHPGGFYDRKTGQIGAYGSYLDNLALTDRSLGELMEWIRQTPLASKTTVIVCSDHSWRVPMWSGTALWTKEDEAASHGRFDPRPVLMVHLPGETAPGVVTEPFQAIREHDLVESLLHGAMTPEALEAWARGR